MRTTRRNYGIWIKPSPRRNLIERLKEDIKRLSKIDELENIQDIFIGAITDSYQPIEAEYKQTRQIIQLLIENKLPFSILTKSGLVLRDIDLLKGYKWCRVGTTITSLDENFRQEIEPFTASYQERIHVLETLKANGISTYLSCEPIMPVPESDPSAIVQKLQSSVDLFDFGMYTYKGAYDYVPIHFLKHYKDDKFYVEAFTKAINYCNENKINYCIASHSMAFLRKHGLPFKPYPPIKTTTIRAQTILTDFITIPASS